MPVQITDKLPGERGPYLSEVVGSLEKKAAFMPARQKERDAIPQEASNIPSGLNLTEDIDMVWPLSVCLSS